MEYPTPFAIFEIDTNGTVISKNRRAYEYSRRGSVKIESDQIQFADTETQNSIQDAILDACEYRTSDDAVIAGICDRNRTIHCLVRPSSPEESIGCIVVLHDPHAGIRVSSERLAQLYNLTRKETLVATTAATGLAPNRACSDLSISLPTYRTHMQRILRKCGASNQAHLSVMLSSGIACA